MTTLQDFLTWAFGHSDQFNKVALAATAIVAVVVSPLIQLGIVAWQVRVQSRIAGRVALDNIATKRQVWVDGLRSDLAEYLTHSSLLFNAIDDVKKQTAAGKEISPSEATLLLAAVFEKAEVPGLRAVMRLNPAVAIERELAEMLFSLDRHIEEFAHSDDLGQKGMAAALQGRRLAIIAKAQGLFDSEWSRIRLGQT